MAGHDVSIPVIFAKNENADLSSATGSCVTLAQSTANWNLRSSSEMVPNPSEHGLIVETGIRRNDSYAMFGDMETVSLDVSEQEPPSVTLVPQTLTTDNSKSVRVEESELKLSKYFSLEPEVSVSMPAKGDEFFDALSSSGALSNSSEFLTPSQEIATIISSTQPSDIQGDSKKALDSSGAFKNEQPDITKYFVQDTSGTDAIGKTFFDVLAKDNVSQISTPDSAKDALPSDTFLNPELSPLSNTNCETAFLMSPISPMNDQMYDAWIPSEKTRLVLVAMATSPVGSYFPEKEHLTLPGIIIEEDMADPVMTLLKDANSPMAEERKALTVADVSHDEEGLKKLVKTGSYHAAVNLTSRLLTSAGQGPGQLGHVTKHTPYTLQLWFTRLALLVKLRKFSLVEVESEAFGDFDKPDLYFEFYPDVYAGRKGTMVSFSFRLLLAEIPQYQGNQQATLDNLYHILTIVQKIIHNLQNDCAEDGSMIELTASRRKASLELWLQRECRIFYSILNCVLSLKDYVLAVFVTKTLIEKDRDHVHQLYSALGRIYLQLGDTRDAQASFNCAAEENVESKDIPLQVEDLVNSALLAVARNEYEEAHTYFQEAYTLQPENAMLANNIAVCLLYLGRLKQSLAMLEKTVQSRPHECLHDGILFNTCTLYELESSRSTIKKFAMLNLVSTHAGDSFNVSCLKIPTSKG